MTTLSFNGTSNYVEFGTLTGALASLTAGAHTLVMLVKRGTATAGFYDPFAICDSARSTVYAASKFELNVPNGLAYDISRAGAGDDNTNHGSATVWYMMAITVGTADTPDVNFHYRDHTANAAWTHTTGDVVSPGYAAAGTPGAGGFVQHGRWLTGDFFNGLIGVVGAFAASLTNAQLDELKANDRTSDWWNCSAGHPAHLAQCNVAAASLVDLSGLSTVVTPVSAPTLTGADPDRWTFDGTGFVADDTTKQVPVGMFTPQLRQDGWF